MKKPILALCIVIAALLAPAGCGGQVASPTPVLSPGASAAEASPSASPAITPAPAYWTQTYRNEGENDSTAAILPAADGGFLLIGLEGHHSDAESREVYRTFLMKTDASGQQVRKRTLEDYQSLIQVSQVSSVLKTGNNGLAILETRMVHPAATSGYRYELVLIKADENGDRLWSKTFETEINAYQVSFSISGSNFVIYGPTFSGSDFEVLEIDAVGAMTQRRTLPLTVSGTDYQNTVMRAAAGGDFLFAAKKITGERQSVLLAARTDRDGRVLWTRTCEALGFQLSPSQIQETSDGGITIIGSAGATTDMMRPWAELYVVRLDSSGNQLWSLTWGDKNHRYSSAAAIETGDNGYLIAGQKSQLAPMPGMAYILKIDEEGKEQWSRTFDDLSGINKSLGSYVRSQADSLLQVPSGFLMAGEYGVFPPGPPDQDIFLMKTDAQGNLDLSPLQNLRPAPAAATEDPENTFVRTIPVDRAVTVNGTTFTLEKMEIRGKGFSFSAFYSPPGFDPAAPLPSSIPGAMAEYSLDGGPARELPVPPFSLTEKGIRYNWLSADQMPPETREITIRITRLGTQTGLWEFKVRVD
jgi:hypothetical protein